MKGPKVNLKTDNNITSASHKKISKLTTSGLPIILQKTHPLQIIWGSAKKHTLVMSLPIFFQTKRIWICIQIYSLGSKAGRVWKCDFHGASK